MRIVAGQYGGRHLESPKDNAIRPTNDKVRGAIFNILGARIEIEGTNILDAFCGSGALGLEALSRGAKHCTFIDNARQSLDLCKRNTEALNADKNAIFHLKDSSKFIATITAEPFDIILLDPPYNKDLILPTLAGLKQTNLIAKDSYIVIESERKWNAPLPDNFEIKTEKIYNDTKIIIAHYTG